MAPGYFCEPSMSTLLLVTIKNSRSEHNGYLFLLLQNESLPECWLWRYCIQWSGELCRVMFDLLLFTLRLTALSWRGGLASQVQLHWKYSSTQMSARIKFTYILGQTVKRREVITEIPCEKELLKMSTISKSQCQVWHYAHYTDVPKLCILTAVAVYLSSTTAIGCFTGSGWNMLLGAWQDQ